MRGLGQALREQAQQEGRRRGGSAASCRLAPCRAAGPPARAAKMPKSSPAAKQPSPGRASQNKVIVDDVIKEMKKYKLSQVQVGQEARVSQAVISQWLARKYHGHNGKVDKAMLDWLDARENGTLDQLSAPFAKGSAMSSADKARAAAAAAADESEEESSEEEEEEEEEEDEDEEDEEDEEEDDSEKPIWSQNGRGAAPEPHAAATDAVSLAAVEKIKQESATGLTFAGEGDDEPSSGRPSRDRPPAGPAGKAAGGRKRKRPPSLNEALADLGRPTRAAKLASPYGRMISPSEFAPLGSIGQLETPVGMPTPGHTPWGTAPQPFWASEKRQPTPRDPTVIDPYLYLTGDASSAMPPPGPGITRTISEGQVGPSPRSTRSTRSSTRPSQSPAGSDLPVSGGKEDHMANLKNLLGK